MHRGAPTGAKAEKARADASGRRDEPGRAAAVAQVNVNFQFPYHGGVCLPRGPRSSIRKIYGFVRANKLHVSVGQLLFCVYSIRLKPGICSAEAR